MLWARDSSVLDEVASLATDCGRMCLEWTLEARFTANDHESKDFLGRRSLHQARRDASRISDTTRRMAGSIGQWHLIAGSVRLPAEGIYRCRLASSPRALGYRATYGT